MKRLIIIASCAIVLAIAGFLVAQWWLENNFVKILNKKPDRAYDISYVNLDLHAFFRGFELDEVTITPLRIDDSATTIIGNVEHADIRGIHWLHLIARKKASIAQLTFIEPRFEIFIPAHSRKKKTTGKNVQSLFGDILSRGEINKFRIEGGEMRARGAGPDSLEIGFVSNMTLEANNIETDVVQWKYPIPFKLGSFYTSVDSFRILLDDNTMAKGGLIVYDSPKSRFLMNDISLSYGKSWIQVGRELGKQVDLIELDLKKLEIREIGAVSSLYGDIEVQAGIIEIDGLNMRDHRDKNMPRPPDSEKPMFSGMVKSIPFPLKVDSIIIRNSNISYTELPEGKTVPGTVQFNAINGSVVNVTTLDTLQKEFGEFRAVLSARLNGQAEMNIKLNIPYDQESFDITADINLMPLTSLNSTLVPMVGVEARTGLVQRLRINMLANRTSAQSQLILDYTDLDMTVISEKSHKSKPMLSLLAGSAVRRENIPGGKHYTQAEYTSTRNIYRGPFNFMWQTVKEGCLKIVPSKAARSLIGSGEKKSKEKKGKKKKEGKKGEN